MKFYRIGPSRCPRSSSRQIIVVVEIFLCRGFLFNHFGSRFFLTHLLVKWAIPGPVGHIATIDLLWTARNVILFQGYRRLNSLSISYYCDLISYSQLCCGTADMGSKPSKQCLGSEILNLSDLPKNQAKECFEARTTI